MLTQKKERTFVYEHSVGRRFIPSLCPSCPFFKSTRTCLIHTSTVEKEDEITHIYGIAYLDTENPYKRKNSCELREKYVKPYYFNRTSNQQNKNTFPKELVKRLLDAEAYASFYYSGLGKVYAYHRNNDCKYIFRNTKGKYVEVTYNKEKHKYEFNEVKGVISQDYVFVRSLNDTTDPLWENLHLILNKFEKLTPEQLNRIKFYKELLQKNPNTSHLTIIGISETDAANFVAESNEHLYSCFYDQISNTVDVSELYHWAENWVNYYTYFRWNENGKWVDIRLK